MSDKRNKIALWIQAARAPFFTASVIPVLLAAVFALWQKNTVLWAFLPLMLLSVILLHAGTNLINDYCDFKKGVDKKTTFGSSRVLVDGLMLPGQVLKAGIISFSAGLAIGLILVAFRGIPLLIMGLIGLAGGYFYSARPLGLKYIGLGDIMVFILMGPLLVASAYYAITGIRNAGALFASLPIACLVTAILHANNIRDIRFDKSSRIKTLALAIGLKYAKLEYYFLLAAAYISVVFMVIYGILPLASLIVFISLPLAVKNTAYIFRTKEEHLEDIASMDIHTAQLHMAFGALLVFSLLLAAL